MVNLSLSLKEGYWDDFKLQDQDVEYLYNYLLEKEEPQPTRELVKALIAERIRIEKEAIEQNHTAKGDIYQPKNSYSLNQQLVFPAMDWRTGKVISVREGSNYELGEFRVIEVLFDHGELKEFATNLEKHKLNEPPKIILDDDSLDVNAVLSNYGDILLEEIEADLQEQPEFVRIAGNWFPRGLLVDINVGHLNLAEAVLDMAGGGPLSTAALIDQIGLSQDVNKQLLEFSLDWALQNDARFDEVGPAGEVLWYLHRLEPAAVLEAPLFLRFSGIQYTRESLTKEMLDLERDLDDELSPISGKSPKQDEVEICLLYPHWRSGTLPLSFKVRHLFPTAYEAPRIRFMLIDSDTGETFPGWVVREKRYVFGLRDWYEKRGLMTGSLIRVIRGKNPGEVMLKTEHRRSSREWVRTVLVGSDGGIVFAMLKQVVTSPIDDRMAIAVPDPESVDQVWMRSGRDQHSLDQTVMSMARELVKLNPQGHVHASELYGAINIIRRVPPGPILAHLANDQALIHVGDLHFRLSEREG